MFKRIGVVGFFAARHKFFEKLATYVSAVAMRTHGNTAFLFMPENYTLLYPFIPVNKTHNISPQRIPPTFNKKYVPKQALPGNYTPSPKKKLSKVNGQMVIPFKH
jgi:hypothetical protein